MNVLRSMDALLKKPESALAAHPFALFTGAIGCYVLYGLASGFFQGGWSVALAVTKIPLIILASTALCLPSLYVFLGLSGADLAPRAFAATVAGFCGITGLILLALMPVVWLFSVSTLSLGFVVVLHALVWITALVFGRGFLRVATNARGAIGLWLMLLFIVSLQMTTYVRPVLWRDARSMFVAAEKKSFFGHLEEVVRWEPPKTPSPAAATAPAPPR